MCAKDSIATQTCKLSKEEFNDFLTLYHIPSEYHVILPKSNQTVLYAQLGYVGLYTNSFSPANLRLSLTQFFCERLGRYPTCVHVFPLWEYGQQRPAIMASGKGFSTGSSSISVNTEPLKADEELVIQPTRVTADSRESLKPEVFIVYPGSVAARIKDRKYKTREASSRPPIKRKLAPGSSTYRATHAKTSSLKDDVPYLIVFDDDEGLLDVLDLKDAIACHLKTFAITPLAWKNHLDNYMDVVLLDLHDCCYARQAVVDNAVNMRSRKLLQVIEKLRGEFDVMRDMERAREDECEELQAKCYQQSLSTLESKVTSLDAKKARFFGGTIPSGKPLGKPKNLSGLLILISFHDT
nr:hypothetical protein [Tanacetum cinerariifolium]